jgi:hypothetical protein
MKSRIRIVVAAGFAVAALATGSASQLSAQGHGKGQAKAEGRVDKAQQATERAADKTARAADQGLDKTERAASKAAYQTQSGTQRAARRAARRTSRTVRRTSSRSVTRGNRVLCEDGTWAYSSTGCANRGGLASRQYTPTPRASEQGILHANEHSAVARAYSNTISRHAIARCSDGTYWHATTRTNACSGHGGVATWL